MARRPYEGHKAKLQVELLKAQRWIKETGQQVIVIFEGRDAAGKGGTIKRFMEHLNPRGAQVVALEKPSEREQRQWYFQRYIDHLPSGGEIVFFDRSWYKPRRRRAGHGLLLAQRLPRIHAPMPAAGADAGAKRHLALQVLFSVTAQEQKRRFAQREHDP
jgi:polyphosphate kinase 2 (PPK2 family)